MPSSKNSTPLRLDADWLCLCGADVDDACSNFSFHRIPRHRNEETNSLAMERITNTHTLVLGNIITW